MTNQPPPHPFDAGLPENFGTDCYQAFTGSCARFIASAIFSQMMPYYQDQVLCEMAERLHIRHYTRFHQDTLVWYIPEWAVFTGLTQVQRATTFKGIVQNLSLKDLEKLHDDCEEAAKEINEALLQVRRLTANVLSDRNAAFAFLSQSVQLAKSVKFTELAPTMAHYALEGPAVDEILKLQQIASNTTFTRAFPHGDTSSLPIRVEDWRTVLTMMGASLFPNSGYTNQPKTIQVCFLLLFNSVPQLNYLLAYIIHVACLWMIFSVVSNFIPFFPF